MDGGFLSLPEALEWTSPAGHQVHGPLLRACQSGLRASQRPNALPCSCSATAGPTSAASTALRYPLQYWTSRGFAVLDVNYAGSTGYGREYRRRLNGQWGVIDVEDCCAGALFLARQGLVDTRPNGDQGRQRGRVHGPFLPDRSQRGLRRWVPCYYGIADLELLAKDSHKFELHYLDTLIGPYPERRDLYLARSPIQNVERLRCALILFQGEDDRVVPPAQSQLMFDGSPPTRPADRPTAIQR